MWRDDVHLAPKTFASGFSPFNVSLGNPYPGNGASQASSIGPLSIDAVGYAYNLGQQNTACFQHRQVAESYCSVWFTLTEPTEYTFIYDTIPSLSPNLVGLQGPSGWQYFYENPGFYEGVLEAGSWRFLASVRSEGFGYDGTSYSAHLILAPEPSGALVAVAGALLIGARRRRTLR